MTSKERTATKHLYLSIISQILNEVSFFLFFYRAILYNAMIQILTLKRNNGRKTELSNTEYTGNFNLHFNHKINIEKVHYYFSILDHSFQQSGNDTARLIYKI